jgi:predicted NAD/FAD-binding protein
MRAFAGGFYRNLVRLYDYLGVQYHSQQFVFSFSRLSSTSSAPYMAHASNFHTLPPVPHNVDFFAWLLEALYAIFFNIWFTSCVYYVSPFEHSPTRPSERFGDYLQRIFLPQYYVSNYLLPLMSSVCTCSHQELLDFPASDVLQYKRRTHGQPHYVVDSGVRTVQDRLSRGLDISFGVNLSRVLPKSDGVELHYTNAAGITSVESFDRVVLAISPDVVAAVFEPVKDKMERIPTTVVDTVAHKDTKTLPILSGGGRPEQRQSIHFRSNKDGTEAIHEQPLSSFIVTTNPLTPIDSSSVLKAATFTRVLRSPESRRIVNDIFAEDSVNQDGTDEKSTRQWRNGDNGIYLAGGWCWDGMVLLEGCVVSAMRVASDLDVAIPWM